MTKAMEQNRVDIVRSIFNGMSEEYDRLTDPWYQYTFGTIDQVLINEFALPAQSSYKPVALDVGCGTGIQSLRLAALGYRVVGVDIAEKLLTVARTKLMKAGWSDASLYIADAQSLPFADSFADCINCCGPTLSFIPNWQRSLAEMARCLKPGGRLLLEVEGKWNPDLFWEVINALGFNALRYDESLATALRHFAPPWSIGHTMNYPFRLESGHSVSMPLKLFTANELRDELEHVNLFQEKGWALHVLTNLIPSTCLHNPNLSTVLRRLFHVLATVERRVNWFWPFNALGCSILIIARKRQVLS